jgi:hypothetical protein
MIFFNFTIASLPLDIRLFISLLMDPSLVIIVPTIKFKCPLKKRNLPAHAVGI